MGNSGIRLTPEPDSISPEVGPGIFLFLWRTSPGLSNFFLFVHLDKPVYVRNDDLNVQPEDFFMINSQILKTI